MEGRKSHRSKQTDKDAFRTGKKMTSSGHGSGKSQDKLIGQGGPSAQGIGAGSLLVTHGKTEVVSTSYLLGNREEGVRGKGGRGERGGEKGGGGKDIPHKKLKTKLRKVVITDSDSEEGEESQKGGKEHTVVMEYAEKLGLVMRLDKRFCPSGTQSSSIVSVCVLNVGLYLCVF